MLDWETTEAAVGGVLQESYFAKYTGKHLCQSLFLKQSLVHKSLVHNFIEKETLAQVFFLWNF